MNLKLAHPKPSISTLAYQWKAAKEQERLANVSRVEIEKLMLEHFSAIPEGTVSADLEGGGKIKVTYKVTRKVDTTALMQAWENNMPENARKIFKWSADVDTKAMRAAQEMDADAFSIAAKFFETKEAKPSITVEV